MTLITLFGVDSAKEHAHCHPLDCMSRFSLNKRTQSHHISGKGSLQTLSNWPGTPMITHVGTADNALAIQEVLFSSVPVQIGHSLCQKALYSANPLLIHFYTFFILRRIQSEICTIVCSVPKVRIALFTMTAAPRCI